VKKRRGGTEKKGHSSPALSQTVGFHEEKRGGGSNIASVGALQGGHLWRGIFPDRKAKGIYRENEEKRKNW